MILKRLDWLPTALFILSPGIGVWIALLLLAIRTGAL